MRFKIANSLIICSLMMLYHTTVLAVGVADLVKVTKETDPQCVEYYLYKGESYCSTDKKMTAPIDAAMLKEEKQHIVFDGRAWHAVWGHKDDRITTLEYVTIDDNIEHWRELVTTQFISIADDRVTPKDFADDFIGGLKAGGYHPVVVYHKDTPDVIIFEWRLDAPENQIQDELVKVTKAPGGLYVIHYVIKKNDMGEKSRHAWLKNLESSSIK